MSEWIPVEQGLPPTRPGYKDGPESSGPVLIFNGFFVTVGYYEQTYKRRDWNWKGSQGANTTVTHWKPMPDPPAAIRETEEVA